MVPPCEAAFHLSMSPFCLSWQAAVTKIFGPESTTGWRVAPKLWWWQTRHEGPSTVLNRPCQALAQHTLSGTTFGGGKAAGAGPWLSP